MIQHLKLAFISASVFILLLPGVVLIGCNEQRGTSKTPQETSASQPAEALSTPKTVPPAVDQTDLRTAIIRVAQVTIPTVVHIEVTQRQEIPNFFLPFEDDPFFRYFFNVPREPKKYQRELKGLGTGVLMDSQGHILTNNHVVGGATEIKVLLSNGKEYPAKLIGADPKTDLAVIKIEAEEPFPSVTFGDSDAVEVGEWVVAIGHPRGLDQTVTQGIISAKHRQGVTDPSSYQDFLQTDAAINPGNSGGPLLNLQGKVIGINAAIASVSGGYEGIGFAIPSNMADHVARALIAHGKVERGWLGITVQDVTSDLAPSFGRKSTEGALVADIVKDGPADKSGLERGDVVLSFNGKSIADANALRNAVADTPIGQEVAITVWRNGKEQQLTVRIGNMEEMAGKLSADITQRLGVEVRPVTEREAKRFNITPDVGVVISLLDPKGRLGQAGFEVDDIILQVNGQPIAGTESFASLVSSADPSRPLTLLALDHRSGRTGYIQLPPAR